MKTAVEIPRHEIEVFCKRWAITEFSLFGSILREDFHADSDIDVLVRFAENARWSLLEHIRMEEELTEILGRQVGIVPRAAVEASDNWIRRKHILSNMETIYPSPCCRRTALGREALKHQETH